MELTINNLIKMVIAVLVIVVVIGGLFMAMKSYVLPYFAGLGFEESNLDVNSQFGQELIKDKNRVGRVDSKGFFITLENVETEVYFKDQKVRIKEVGFRGVDEFDLDAKAGTIGKDGRLEVEPITEYYEILNGAYKYGSEIYKIGGVDGEIEGEVESNGNEPFGVIQNE
jgi:hypothetical protein